MSKMKLSVNVYDIFYTESKEDIDEVIRIIPKFNINEKQRFDEEVFLWWKNIPIYVRTYFLDDWIEKYYKLNKKQKLIFDCLNTTQSNWYKREASLKKIIKHQEPYIPYFVLRLLWEHVTYLQWTILENIEYIKTDAYKKFITENIKFYNIIQARVFSYWAEYRRLEYPRKKDFHNQDWLTRDNYPWLIIIKNLKNFTKI